ncbi:MAG: hypothetical protein ACHP7N_12800 [Caulobacterales bacterium]
MTVAALVLFAALTPAAAAPTGVADAEAFMRAFYALAKTPPTGPSVTQLEQYFTPDLAKALATDYKRDPQNGWGSNRRVDLDYRIESQVGDIDHVTISSLATAQGARVDVRFQLKLDSTSPPEPGETLYDLKRTPAGWRIDEVSAPAQGFEGKAWSMRRLLRLPAER